jgi:hypothetical protein
MEPHEDIFGKLHLFLECCSFREFVQHDKAAGSGIEENLARSLQLVSEPAHPLVEVPRIRHLIENMFCQNQTGCRSGNIATDLPQQLDLNHGFAISCFPPLFGPVITSNRPASSSKMSFGT